MLDDDRFWCDDCRTFVPSVIQAQHEESHAEEKAQSTGWLLWQVVTFWVFCVIGGAVAGAAVATVLSV